MELETVWSGDKGVYIGSCLREMAGHAVIRPPKGAPAPRYDTIDAAAEAKRIQWTSDLCADIDAYVKAHPGSTVTDIYNAVGRNFRAVQEAVYRMVKRKHLRPTFRKFGRGRPSPVYEAVPPCERPPKRRSTRDITEHIREVLIDGMTVFQIAKAIGATRWQCRRALSNMLSSRELLCVQMYHKFKYYRNVRLTASLDGAATTKGQDQ